MNKQNVNVQLPDVKKVLGNPKITFVLGGPASGKGTQCSKLVEEFGYTHISTGDLFRAEVAKGSREGSLMKEIMDKGELIPHHLVVQVLINALIANPSKNYLIDGFPRAQDQAIYFERVVGEAQAVLYFNTPLDVCIERCMIRAATSGRSDDNEETIRKRLQTFIDESKPVVDMYQRFGKVREVDGSGDQIEVFKATRKAMLPQVSWIVGPKMSGKTVVGSCLASRTNAKLLNFKDFIAQQGLQNSDDETIVHALIQQLALEISPRILIENFPQNSFQAKFFIKNSVCPSRVFVLSCSKDLSQERMTGVAQSDPSYMPSALLSKSIADYNANLKDLQSFLRSQPNILTEICTEQSAKNTHKEVCQVVEPTIINVRTSGSEAANDAQKQIQENLQEQGYITLNVKDLVELECERGTDIGLKIKKDAWNADAGVVVDVLKRVIYSGIDGHSKFLLCGFPESIDQARAFEENCAKIAAIVYTTAKGSTTVEIKDNNLSDKNIDTLFSKQFRLKTMNNWDASTFEEHLGKRVSWGIVTGRDYSGSAMVTQELCAIVNGKQIKMAAIAEELKKKMGTEEEPFEGEVPVADVQVAVCAQIKADQASGVKCTYLFDSWVHKNIGDFLKFAQAEFGCPSFAIHCLCDKKIAEERYKKMNEAEEISEDAAAELEDSNKRAEKNNSEIQAMFGAMKDKVRCITLNTEGSNETVLENIKGHFAAKIILVNHEKRLQVDTTCSNLAIKFNMLYLSVYQLIKNAIQKCSPIGKELEASRKPRSLCSDASVADEYCEDDFSAVHFDMELVIRLICQTIADKRTNQQFILLEGCCNNRKLADAEDKLTLRYMDELFQIEKHIGEVSAVISLQDFEEADRFTDEKWEEFPEPIKEEPKKKPANGEDEDEVEEAAPEEDEEEKKKPKWNPAEYKWTVTDRRAKNLPQLFRDYKGINCLCEIKPAAEISKDQSLAVTKSMDDFCSRVMDEHTSRYIYQQVTFEC